jgi:peptidoglycan/xylan/chitin deacetylase (PgdA/CDA1 family)
MIGVIAAPAEEAAVREFFELFKTPWEFYRSSQSYDVVLCSGDLNCRNVSAKVLIAYAGQKTDSDGGSIEIHSQRTGGEFSFLGKTFPIYGNALTFRCRGTGLLKETASGETAACLLAIEGRVFARVGYDLFGEVRTLLVKGQPASNAAIPTLDLHIWFLRSMIAYCGVELLEIPPVPDGYRFIACLTHDLDHASIRRHKFDSTMFGFVYRATAGSVVKFVRGQLTLRKLLRNWLAVAKLPFIYLGLAKDFWYEFDRYLEIEQGRPSTFFIIPFARFPGRSVQGEAPPARGSGYDVSDVAEKIPRLTGAGCEIGLHGLDAWIDSSRGRLEANRISEFSKKQGLGVRMHWLYNNHETFARLEEADFSFDSTVGYNEAVGYRAGTAQTFKPLSAERILELPLHVMDTALFYPGRLNLTEKEAWHQVDRILDNASAAGGVLTINWHDRSIAPERLWDDFYVRLLEKLSEKGACFLTASQAVAWFRLRRSIVFEKVENDGRVDVIARTMGETHDGIPALLLRCHRPRPLMEPESWVDKSFNTRAFQSINQEILSN